MGKQKQSKDSFDTKTTNELPYTLLDNLLEGCQILDFNWNYIYINKSAENQIQKSSRELIGKKIMDVWPHMKQTEVFGQFKTCMEQRVSQNVECNIKFSNNEITWLSISIQPIPEGVLVLSIDITDRKAKKRAEDSDHLKTAFLHNISHEIRTPMNAIIGFVSLLKDTKFSVEKRKRYFDIIEQSSNQLLAIVTDIIDIASIEAGHVKICKTQVKINSLMSLIFDQYKHVAEKKGIQLNYETELNHEVIITTDETKVIQIITNLINNALKFTEKGKITFGYTLKNSTIEFYVKDTGIGIPAKLREKIFDRFHQVESPKVDSNGGSGLGLSISKGYLDLLGGKIWTESRLGKGSTFYFTLPNESAIKHSQRV